MSYLFIKINFHFIIVIIILGLMVKNLLNITRKKNSGNRTFKDLLSKYMVGMSAAVINVNSMKIDDIKFDFKYQLVEDYDFFEIDI